MRNKRMHSLKWVITGHKASAAGRRNKGWDRLLGFMGERVIPPFPADGREEVQSNITLQLLLI